MWSAGKLTVGETNAVNETFVAPMDIILTPLHIKLGLTKQFVNSGQGLAYLTTKFPLISEGCICGTRNKNTNERWYLRDTWKQNISKSTYVVIYWESIVPKTGRDLRCNILLEVYFLHSHPHYQMHRKSAFIKKSEQCRKGMGANGNYQCLQNIAGIFSKSRESTQE